MKVPNQLSGGRDLFVWLLAIFWPPFLVFFLHVFLVRVLNIYSYIHWLDIPMHYLGGLSMAFSVANAQASIQELKIIRRLDKAVELLLIFTVVVTIAVFWEFAEFLADHFLGTDLQVSLPNTMQDLLMGILGAATIAAYRSVRYPKPGSKKVADYSLSND